MMLRLPLGLLASLLAVLSVSLLPSAPAEAKPSKDRRGHITGISAAKALSGAGRCSARATASTRRQLRLVLSGKTRHSDKQRRRVARRHRNFLKQQAKKCKRPAPTNASGGPLYWGAWIGNQLTGDEAPWDMGATAKFEQMAGKKLSLLHFSSPFADCSRSCSYYEFPRQPMDNIRGHGAIPVFSWASQSTPANLNQPDFQLSDVLEGRHDSYIRSFAEGAREWGHPFFLRFNWEMNGNWFAWTEGANGNRPGEYVAVWRHVREIFRSVGANNATWVWCPNIDPDDMLQDLDSLYPGDAYVDWTCLDGYNWGTHPVRDDKWRSFEELYRSTYREVTESIAPGKPMLIGEMGSTEHGGSKASWISDALASIPTNFPRIRGMMWFEKFDDQMDWPIETSAGATSAFAAGIQHPSYLSTPANPSGGVPIQPPS